MRRLQTPDRLLLVFGLAGLFLFALFISMANGPGGYEHVAHAAPPSTTESRKGMDEAGSPLKSGYPNAEDDPRLWTAIETAYHDGDRQRLVALGERLGPEQQETFERLLVAFDGETDGDDATVLAPADVTAPEVGINGTPCSYATIGAAISAAADGDTIYIPSGNTYFEQLGTIDKDLTFVASVADCSGEDSGATSTSVVIDGGGADGGIWGGIATIALSKTVTFNHILLRDARASYGGIFYLDPGATLILDNSEVAYGEAASHGGGVRVYSDAALILKNESFIHRNAVTGTTSGGGGVSAYQGAITMTGGSAIGLGNGGNTSADQGGGVYLQSSTFYAKDANVLANDAMSEGGGVYAFGGSVVELHGLARIGGYLDVFSNTAQIGGGAYLAGASTGLVLSDTAGVVMNYASGDGGGVYAEAGPYLAMRGGSAEVLSNTAFFDGGGVYLTGDGTRLNMIYGGGQIEGNEAQGGVGGGGGGVYVTQGASVYAEQSIIERNTTGLYGGGIHVAQDGVVTPTSVILNNSTVVSDNSAWIGGGMYIADDGSDVVVSGSRVENNRASQTGGGIRIFGDSQLDVRNGSTLQGNQATNYGGGLAMFTGTVTLDVVTMTYNTSSGDGGAILQSRGALTITDGDIRFNSAGGNGGGLYADASTIVLRDTHLVGNEAGEDGGGAYVRNGSVLLIDTSYFYHTPACDPATFSANEYCSEVRGNQASGWGAGVYVDQSTATINNTAFLDNVGLSSGTAPGAALLVGRDASVTASNVLFTGHGTNGNTAVHVYSDARYTSIHGTYAGNMDFPLLAIDTSAVTLTNNILWDNGDDAFYQSAVTLTASCNDTQDLLPGAGNISADPKFVTTSRGNYRLGIGSPVVDACSGTLDHDLDDVRRPINADGSTSPTEFDMGAFERGTLTFLPLTLRNAP